MRDEEAYFVLVCASALDGRALLVRKTRIILLFKIRIESSPRALLSGLIVSLGRLLSWESFAVNR